jgi:hypothetical protein
MTRRNDPRNDKQPRRDPRQYGYLLTTGEDWDGWGLVSVLGDTVTIYSPACEWPRCMHCDSLTCLHLQEMYTRAGVRMPDAIFPNR